jgi:hypothetical protein
MMTGAAAITGICIMLVLTGSAAAAGSLCRIDDGPCTAIAAGMTMTFEIAPRPVRAMRELTFSVVLRHRDRYVEDASVTVELTMPGMEMGRNVVVLKHTAGGRYEGKGVIVRCPSGGRTWKASIAASRRSGTAVADLLFEVH